MIRDAPLARYSMYTLTFYHPLQIDEKSITWVGGGGYNNMIPTHIHNPHILYSDTHTHTDRHTLQYNTGSLAPSRFVCIALSERGSL